MSPPRVLFVNRFYWPEQPATAQLLTDLAEGLANRGWMVTVLARRPSRGQTLLEVRRGVTLQRICTVGWGRRSLAGRALDFSSFIVGARRALRAGLEPQDVVVTLTDPPMIGAALADLIRSRGARQVHWIQDIFPEVAATVSGRKEINRLIPWRDRAWQQSAHCVVPGHDMSALVQRHGVARSRLTVSENWGPAGVAPVDSAAWRQRHQLVGKFIVMYSGNLGRVHDFSALVPLARLLGPASGVTFVFVGEGAQRLALQTSAERAGLEQVLFLPPQPREELSEVLSAGDLHLVSLRAGCEELVFPSKLYGIASVGRPTLVIGPRGCEPGRAVAAAGCGAAFLPHEISAMAALITRLRDQPDYARSLGQAALVFAEEHGQLSQALATWEGVLQPLLQPTRTQEIGQPSPLIL